MKQFIKKIVPRSILNIRHLFFAWLGASKYGHPSEEIFVIGVTGTSGKSTVIALLRQLLEARGEIVGSLSTIDFYIAGKKKLNDKKMTMLGKMQIQQYLRQMVDAGCTVAIVETTSEGRLQHRHRFINYDTMILTNLYREHIEAHGSFANYKQAKVDIFSYAAKSKHKTIQGKTIPKVGIANSEKKRHRYFLEQPFDHTITFGPGGDLEAKNMSMDKEGIHFDVHTHHFDVAMYGAYNVTNILAVIAFARSLDISWKEIVEIVSTFKNIEGRIEFIPEAREHGFDIIVDYAFEPVALSELYKVVKLFSPKRIIHVCGSTGGGRDKARREPIGNIVASNADIFFVTDEDPYDEDPREIMAAVSKGAQKAGMKKDLNLFEVLSRKEAIRKAVQMAKKGDLVLITGKGSEQAMCVAGGKMIPWDDRTLAREALKRRH